jgi:hypothetical protein
MGELTFKKPGTTEWDAMWAWVAAHTLNAGLVEPTVGLCPFTNEAWQYMGTRSDGADEFRHRHHPRTQKREYLARSEA